MGKETLAAKDAREEAFSKWMGKVNARLIEKTGMTSEDLPDCCYRDWFDDGMQPRSAAAQVIKAAKGE